MRSQPIEYMKLIELLILHVPMPWAQGVVSSNLAAPTKAFIFSSYSLRIKLPFVRSAHVASAGALVPGRPFPEQFLTFVESSASEVVISQLHFYYKCVGVDPSTEPVCGN